MLPVQVPVDGGVGEAAVSAERRLSKEPRMETTASVAAWLWPSDSRSSAAHCARPSISLPEDG